MKHPTQSVAIYGGSFDPVHLGHLAVARAAIERFALERVYFVPADVQPLKAHQKATNFYHRYAMLSLALAGEARMLPSLLEAPEIVRAEGQSASYTVDTVLRLRRRLQSEARIFFLIGMDAFQSVAKWRCSEQLLASVEFIVAHRPGFPLADLQSSLPAGLRPDEGAARRLMESGTLAIGGAKIHLLPDVSVAISATEIRRAARRGDALEPMVPAGVADYIRKLKIYEEVEEPGTPEPPRI